MSDSTFGGDPTAKKPNAVTVRIWYPHPTAAGFGQHTLTGAGLGHASLTVKLDGVRHYITWQVKKGLPSLFWEEQARSYETNGAYIPLGQMHKSKDETFMNNMNWGKMNGESGRGRDDESNLPRSECDWKKRIKTRSSKGGSGLDAEAIIAWWRLRVANENTYKLLSTTQNCTGCVVEALKAGGLGGSPSGTFVVTAADLRTWVELQIKQQDLELGEANAGYEKK